MGHIPFCFYPSLLEQWLNCFNNLYMGKTFKRQIKCNLESVQIELSQGHWILNTKHTNPSIQNHPYSQSTYISARAHAHTITHILNQHTSVQADKITHIHSFFLHLIVNYIMGKNMCLLPETLLGLVKVKWITKTMVTKVFFLIWRRFIPGELSNQYRYFCIQSYTTLESKFLATSFGLT